MSTDDLRSLIRENLRNATENGYEELYEMTTHEVALDMICYAPECELMDPAQMYVHIDEFFGRAIASGPHSKVH